mmetsp:Transcript_30822/g.92440  ORF Transcript_30822/g.92440 Transcript_30822/m.92440 type:complete len:238 (+) Transcript_30822:453-1166(+)
MHQVFHCDYVVKGAGHIQHAHPRATRTSDCRRLADIVEMEGVVDRLTRHVHHVDHRSIHETVGGRGNVHVQDTAMTHRSDVAIEDAGCVGMPHPWAPRDVVRTGPRVPEPVGWHLIGVAVRPLLHRDTMHLGRVEVLALLGEGPAVGRVGRVGGRATIGVERSRRDAHVAAVRRDQSTWRQRSDQFKARVVILAVVLKDGCRPLITVAVEPEAVHRSVRRPWREQLCEHPFLPSLKL